MARIDAILATTSKSRNFIILFALTVINFSIIGYLSSRISAISGGYTLLDFSFGHTMESVNETLQNYGTEGIALYRWVQRIDLIHPMIYSLLFASLLFIFFRQTRFKYLSYLPFLGGALDYLENIFLFQMVNSFPNISQTTIQMGSILNLAKNIALLPTAAAFVFGLVLFIKNRAAKQPK